MTTVRVANGVEARVHAAGDWSGTALITWDGGARSVEVPGEVARALLLDQREVSNRAHELILDLAAYIACHGCDRPLPEDIEQRVREVVNG